MASALVDIVDHDSEYDILMCTLAEASGRFDELEKTVIELRQLCESSESDGVHSEQILEVLERHGA